MTSKSDVRRATASNCAACAAVTSTRGRASLSARGQIETSFARVRESPLAKSVTSCPSPTSSSTNHETTLSVPPYNFGGTLSANGAICAIRSVSAHPFIGITEPMRYEFQNFDASVSQFQTRAFPDRKWLEGLRATPLALFASARPICNAKAQQRGRNRSLTVEFIRWLRESPGAPQSEWLLGPRASRRLGHNTLPAASAATWPAQKTSLFAPWAVTT